MIRLHWWRTNEKQNNFGDELSRFICEQLSKQWTEWAPLEDSQLVSIGSLLASHLNPDFCWEKYTGSIWGTGFMIAGEQIDLSQVKVFALRGRYSLNQAQINQRENIALGDPGLLSHLLVRRKISQRYPLGIMPHWSDSFHPYFRGITEKHPEICLMSPMEPVDTIIEKICSCENILSSSLHGLIVADAFGIPNRWLRLNTGQEDVNGATLFKFRDYYSLFGLEKMTPVAINDCLSRNEILNHMHGYHRPGLEQIQQSLIQSFPQSLLD
ncbi:polysaccharide pyruvyl transferase family protein [uncultured Rubinisphaera sp.]|uniref:polysaccharide pyruvyl transferase family protein n=1 Tax=uncultured Rubinisphaera sp. TaxID=1678686 RepID=UPI0030D945D1|tara:strand:+ start:2588 stop:3394 length:807 start_codon:yes stop_codon:yes gene_type:complete